jgi:hypothetical protein
VSETYYAANKTDQFIDMVREGVRDLRSDKLRPYYESEEVSRDEVEERAAASTEFRSDNDLPPISQARFVSQISAAGAKSSFILLANQMGLESRYVEDLYEEESEGKLPEIPGLGDTIQILVRKGFAIDREALDALYPGADLSGGERVFHLREETPTVWGEEDSLVAAKMRRTRTFVRLYEGV